MSKTNLSKEFGIAVKYFNLTLSEIEKLTINAMKSAFIHFDDRIKIIYDIIKPGFTKVRNEIVPLD
jgi:adenosine deaminase